MNYGKRPLTLPTNIDRESTSSLLACNAAALFGSTCTTKKRKKRKKDYEVIIWGSVSIIQDPYEHSNPISKRKRE